MYSCRIIHNNIITLMMFTLLLMFLGCGGSSLVMPNKIPLTFEVDNVVDGNTIRLRRVIEVTDGFRTWRTRTVEYIGVKALERNDPFYGSSKECNVYLLRKHRIKLEFDMQKIDNSSKKILAYVYAEDIFINAEMIKKGYAKSEIIEPNKKYTALFQKLELEAKENRRGIWSYRSKPNMIIEWETRYVASESSNTFHLPSCSSVRKIDDKKKVWFESYKEAINSGKRPCKICKPDESQNTKN